MNYKTIIMLCLLLFGVCVHAQDNDVKVKKQINSIKKNSQYLYGEATAESEVEAKDLAEDILYQEINQWAAQKKRLKNSPNIVVSNKKELQTAFSLPRGNMYRYFVYVKKSDIMPGENVEVIYNNIPEASKVEHIPQPSAEQDYPEAVKIIASYTDYYNMADKIKDLKAEGKIRHYARYASLEKPEIYYLAIYNTEGKVVAVLTPGTNRTNVKTSQPDKVTNYSGCGAIGFTVNE